MVSKQKTSKPKTTKATCKQAFDRDNKKIPVTAGRLLGGMASEVSDQISCTVSGGWGKFWDKKGRYGSRTMGDSGVHFNLLHRF